MPWIIVCDKKAQMCVRKWVDDKPKKARKPARAAAAKPKARAKPKAKPKALRKAVRKPKVILPKPKKGALGKFGYKDVAKMGVVARRNALRKAIAAYGATSVGRKLRLVQTFNRKTNPKVAKIFGADADWVKKQK